MLASLLLCASVSAQETATATNEAIELKLKVTDETVCLKAFVPLELTITNHGPDTVEIRQLDLWRNFTVETVTDEGSHKSGAGFLIWPGTVPEYERLRNEIHIVKPNDTYVTTNKFSLGDERFFSGAARYSLKSYYLLKVESNAVTFEARDCSANWQRK